MNTRRYRLSRRRFLKSTCILASSALPAWYVDQCMAMRPERAGVSSANEQIQLGLVGCGGQGRGDARNAKRFGNVVAVCDVDANHLANAKKDFPEADTYADFREVVERKDLDAVICGTVDHWHTLVSIGAMRAGKDVYCEKPLTLTIDEGKRLVQVQRETGQVLQTGTQQRSGREFRLACDLVRNDRIGKIQKVEVWLPAGLRQGPFKTSAAPSGFDYNFWKGPTADVPYVKERTHFSFRYWWEYSGGTMTDWGAHHNDIVLWALDMDQSGPVTIEGKQLVDMIPGGFTAASEYEVKYTYRNGVVHTCKSTTASEWWGGVKDRDGQQHGIKFHGTDGWIWVTRGTIQASDPQILSQELPESAARVYYSDDHMGNFVDCIKSREEPICPALTGHRSASLCHLGVIAIRLSRKLNWDPDKEQFVGDDEANRHLAREMRQPYGYDML